MTVEEAINEAKKYKDTHEEQYRYDQMREKEYDFMAKIVEKLKVKTVLDVGCAYGTFSLWLKKNGYDVEATDAMPEYHSPTMFKKEKIPFLKHNIETDKVEKAYDCIIFTEVLEHLCYNPLPVLNKLYDALKPGGKIILSTPVREVDPPQPMGKEEKWGRWVHYVNWKQIPEFKKYEFEDNHHHMYYIWELMELFISTKLTIFDIFRTKSTWTVILERKEPESEASNHHPDA